MTLLAGCALPKIQREPKSQPAADAGATQTDAMPPEVLDPQYDPANRYEDFATFQSLWPTAHLFAEWRMPGTAPAPAQSYSLAGNIVTDGVTKLHWQHELPETYAGCRGRHLMATKLYEEGSGCSWEEAQKYCASEELAKALGPGAWRLPTRIELETLIDPARSPALAPMFETSQDDFYWTISPAPNPEGVKLAWAVDFMEGCSYVTGRFKAGRVRCVSSDAVSGGREPKYEMQQRILVDWNTQLTWQISTDSAVRSWDEARSYCEALDVEGRGWRLPALKELLTIVDTRRHMPAIEPRAFSMTQSARFWTSTVFAADEEEAYAVEFLQGESGYFDKPDKHYVRCVR